MRENAGQIEAVFWHLLSSVTSIFLGVSKNFYNNFFEYYPRTVALGVNYIDQIHLENVL